MKIQWLGHSTFLIRTLGKNIYIDPYILPKNSPLADIILITHAHFDHLDKGKIGEIRKPGTVFICNKKTSEELSGYGAKVIEYWESVDALGMKVTAVPAYNPKKNFHYKGDACGFVIEAEGKKLYHAGDTDLIPEMTKLDNIDVAMLPIGGTYTMDVDEAVEASLIIRPRFVIPMHYNMIQGTEADPDEFKQKVENSSDIEVKFANNDILQL